MDFRLPLFCFLLVLSIFSFGWSLVRNSKFFAIFFPVGFFNVLMSSFLVWQSL